MNKITDELYVLMLDGKILSPDSFKEYWKNYGSGASGLYGWRKPKKVYYSLGDARRGLCFVPKEIKDKVEIHKFKSVELCPNTPKSKSVV